MTIQELERASSATYFGARTSWQGGSCRIDVLSGNFLSERAALDRAAGHRSLRVKGKGLFVERTDGPDLVVEEHACLAYDVKILDETQSWPDAVMPWDEVLAAVSSGRPFSCVGRVARPVAWNSPPASAKGSAEASRPAPPQCGQTAN